MLLAGWLCSGTPRQTSKYNARFSPRLSKGKHDEVVIPPIRTYYHDIELNAGGALCSFISEYAINFKNLARWIIGLPLLSFDKQVNLSIYWIFYEFERLCLEYMFFHLIIFEFQQRLRFTSLRLPRWKRSRAVYMLMSFQQNCRQSNQIGIISYTARDSLADVVPTATWFQRNTRDVFRRFHVIMTCVTALILIIGLTEIRYEKNTKHAENGLNYMYIWHTWARNGWASPRSSCFMYNAEL